MGTRTPKLVKEWIDKVDEAERAYCNEMREKEPNSGWVYRKISTGLRWDGSALIVSGCAEREMRVHSKLFDEFPTGYELKRSYK